MLIADGHCALMAIAQRHGLQSSVNSDVVRLISHAAQERLRTVLEKLAVIAEHRQETFKVSVWKHGASINLFPTEVRCL